MEPPLSFYLSPKNYRSRPCSWHRSLAHLVKRAFVLAAALAVSLCVDGCTEHAKSRPGSVQLIGSETMRPLVTMCAADFMAEHPQVDVIVKGGGSGTGIAALLYGTVDICMASRDLSDKERGYASSNGVEISGFDLAFDGIAMVVHAHNPVDTLGLDQLRKIYPGNMRNWQEVGGAPADIVVLSRLAGSGTTALFGERVLDGEDYTESAQGLPTNEAIVAEVVTQPWAIGYIDLGALRHARDRVKAVALRATPQSLPVLPVPETIRSGRYPLARTLHVYTAGKPAGAVKEFIDFCLSSRGHALVQKAGYIVMSSTAP